MGNTRLIPPLGTENKGVASNETELPEPDSQLCLCKFIHWPIGLLQQRLVQRLRIEPKE